MKWMRLLFALGIAIFLAQDSRAAVYWTDWTAAATGLSGSASGTLTTPGGAVSISYAGEVALPTQVGAGTNYWIPNAAYLSAAVPSEPPAADVIALTGASTAANTLTFSQPVSNLVMAILSLGTSATPVEYDFDQPFDVLSFGPGYWGGPGTLTELAGDVLQGVEGHGVIRFPGPLSSLSWTVSPFENWHGFTLGVIPEPSTAAILIASALVCTTRLRFGLAL